MKKTILIGIGVFIIAAIVIVIWAVSTSNSEKKLVNAMDAQKEVVSLYYDKMWKILKQKAGVAEQAKSAFKEIYVPLIEGRYSKGDGTLMKWITEQNPSFDMGLYKDVQNSIEAERNGFFIEQKKLTDMNREHQNLLELFPSSIICGNRPKYEYTPITSAETKEVVRTGEENDIKLFN
jgi:hypothetical protein